MGRKKEFDPYDYPPYRPKPVELPERAADAVPELRAFAASVWSDLVSVFGSSRDLVRAVTLPANCVRIARDWLRHLELLVRRMILILALSKTVAPAKPWGRPSRTPRIRGRDWLACDTWTVSFRMMPRAPRPSRINRATRKPPRWRFFRLTAGIARRIEALRRTIGHPHACARRFARTLARWKAKEAMRNDPRVMRARAWDFHPHRDSRGARVVNDGMRLAAPLAERALAIWQGELIEPG